MSYFTCPVQNLCRSNDEESSALTGGGGQSRGSTDQSTNFADDQAMVAGTEKGIQSIMEETNGVVKSYGMKINSQKTKIMKLGRKPGMVSITLEGVALEQVKDFKYLGSYLSENGNTEKNTWVRIGIDKNVFTHLKPILTGGLRQVNKKTLVWSMATYAAESWIINKADKKKLEAMEMWVWRKMEKVKWTDKLTNEEVLSQFNECRGFMAHIKRRKSRWIGHILRHKSLLRIALEGRIKGKRPRG